MKVDLAGKIVVVTGAASGIGRAVVRRIVQSGVGGVLATDRDRAGLEALGEELAGYDAPVSMHISDLSEPSAGAEIVGAAVQAFGRVDGLVNAAGLTTRAALVDGDAGTWDRLFAVNARAPFFLMQAAIRDMRRRAAPGSIVNILSMNAHCGSPELAIYSATKGALLTLTKNAANAHLGDRIRVNGINLGWALTEAEHVMQSETLGLGADWAEKVVSRLPLGRLLNPEETARHVLFLLSDASEPMTGVIADLEQRVVGA
ncbi:SDR family oxidoreductase [Sulfitobacter sp. D35]|uniref:SDR family oxidoreductase n=1 Tax=Sulfitobacter sp. D35 TaxID=3083252 RepID=UPI00296E4231|nr:SDR family oxidoreductase [Sulfitobacter sp. D35]MDW4499956.1 SDR family oxidoreductase [Sulfitobacter sp. D35]